MNNYISKPSEYKDQGRREEMKLREKLMHGQFSRNGYGIVDQKKSWLWLKNGNLEKGMEALIMAAQEQAIRTNCVKYLIDKS